MLKRGGEAYVEVVPLLYERVDGSKDQPRKIGHLFALELGAHSDLQLQLVGEQLQQNALPGVMKASDASRLRVDG